VIDHLQPAVRRNDIDVVGPQPFAGADLHHGHAGARGDDARHLAAVMRVEMHDDDKGGAGVLRQRAEKALQRVDAARGGADGHQERLDLLPRRRGLGLALFLLSFVHGHSCLRPANFSISAQPSNAPASSGRPLVAVGRRGSPEAAPDCGPHFRLIYMGDCRGFANPPARTDRSRTLAIIGQGAAD